MGLSSRRQQLLAFFSLATLVCCSIDGYRLISILFTKFIAWKDLIQPYFMGHALRAGAYLYSPLPDLAAQFDPSLNSWFQHPSAYPPIVALIGLPLSYLPYFWATVAWLILEVACLAVAVALIAREFGGRKASAPVLITIMAFMAWRPVYFDLYLGQFMVPILLLLTLTWLALKREKDITAGLLLGIVLAIKLYAWPLALFLLLSGRWKAPVIAGVVFAIANLLMVGLVGTETVTSYYLTVGNSVALKYLNDPFNFSAWAIGMRSFGFLGAVVMVLTVLSFSLTIALRSRDLTTGFMVMLSASTILQPISWNHYFVTLLPALCFIANRKDLRSYDLIISFLMIILIIPVYHHLAHTYAPMATFPPFLFVIGLVLMWSVGPLRQRNAVQAIAGETT